MANCKLNPHPTANASTTLHKTAKQVTVVSVHMKPIDVSCSKSENSAKLMTADENTQTEFHKSKFCPVRNRPKLPEISNRHLKLLFHSNLSLTALSSQLLHFSSQLSAASKPSTTTRPGTTKKKPIHWEETCPFRRSCERPRQTCTTSCHSRRTPKPS